MLALASSYLGKVASMLLTLVGLPLAIRHLSTDEFATLGTFSVVVTWAGTVNPAIGPSVGILVATYEADEHQEQVKQTISSAVMVSATFGVLTGALTIILGPSLLGIRDSALLAIAAATALLQNLALTADSVRLGFQRAHRNSLWAAAGSVLAGGAIVLAASLSPTLPAFAAAVFAVSLVVRSASIVDLGPRLGLATFMTYAGLWPSIVEISRRNFFHAAVQLGTFLGFPLALLMYRRSSDEAGATIFVAQVLGFAAIGLMAGALGPLGAATVDAYKRKEFRWIRNALSGLVKANLAVSVVGVLAAASLGPILTSKLYVDAAPSRTTLVLLACSVGLAATFGVFYQVLIGIGQYRRAAIAVVPGYLVGCAIIVTGASMKSIELGVIGAVLAPYGLGLTFLKRTLNTQLALVESGTESAAPGPIQA